MGAHAYLRTMCTPVYNNTKETNTAYYEWMCLVGWVSFCLLFDKTPVRKKFKFK